jgi:uncharacterized protein (TIGR02246 family)
MSDFGFTHVALPVSDVDQSSAFYAKYARMQVIHRRIDPTVQSKVVWLSDLTRPFVLVLIQVPRVEQPLLPIAHLGVACKTREEVDRLCEAAHLEGLLQEGPHDYGYPVGYWAFLKDPDGHTLEVSYGQEIGLTVQQAESQVIERSLIQQAADAWINGDADAFSALFLPEGEFMVPGNCWVGPEAIRQVAADFAAAYSDVKIEIRRILLDNHQAAVEWHWQENEKATGKHGSADDTIVIDFQDGRIRRWREYIDIQSYMRPGSYPRAL